MVDAHFGIAAGFLRDLGNCVARIGGDRERFIGSLGLNETSGAPVRAEHVGQALADLEAELGLVSAGLALAKTAPVGAFGFVDYAAYACPTLREAIVRLAHGCRHISPRAILVLEETESEARIHLRHRSGAPLESSPLSDFVFALLVIRTRAATGHDDVVREVRLTRSTRDRAPFEALFGARTLFEQPSDELWLKRAALDLPFSTADARVAALLDPEPRGHTEPPFLERARAAIIDGLRTGATSVDDLARALALSPRTVQRQLQILGTSHRQLLERARRDLAEELLQRPALPIAAIAEELGFANATAFHRAFLRWTGSTPGAYRTQRLVSSSQHIAA